jgi:hypothetical protein
MNLRIRTTVAPIVLLAAALKAACSAAADGPLTVIVLDPCSRPVPDAEVISAVATVKTARSVQTFDVPRSRWTCRNGSCGASIDDNVVELKLRVRSRCCRAGDEGTFCWSQLQQGNLTLHLTPGVGDFDETPTDDTSFLPKSQMAQLRRNRLPENSHGRGQARVHDGSQLPDISRTDSAPTFLAPAASASLSRATSVQRGTEEMIGSVRVVVPNRIPTDPIHDLRESTIVVDR